MAIAPKTDGGADAWASRNDPAANPLPSGRHRAHALLDRARLLELGPTLLAVSPSTSHKERETRRPSDAAFARPSDRHP